MDTTARISKPTPAVGMKLLEPKCATYKYAQNTVFRYVVRVGEMGQNVQKP